MYTIENLFKTLLIAALVSAGFEFYIASSMFQQSVGIHENPDIGKVEAFIEVSKSVDYFWPHIFKGWLFSFIKVFIACALLLAVVKTPIQETQ